MKLLYTQVPTKEEQPVDVNINRLPPPQTPPIVEAGLLSVALSVVIALGLPQILKTMASNRTEKLKAESSSRAETIRAEASREDEIYRSVLSGSATSLASVLEINKKLLEDQSNNSQKLFDLANTLVIELKELREVVKHNTEVTEKAIKQVEELLKMLPANSL